MAKRSGSRSSRGERRAERQRAERAREHGLPARRPEPMRARAATPQPDGSADGSERSSDLPRVPLRKAGVPTLVKVIGAAAVILLGVYLLGRQRDKALSEGSAPTPEPPTSVAPTSAPSAP
jgi:hypothetical protein